MTKEPETAFAQQALMLLLSSVQLPAHHVNMILCVNIWVSVNRTFSRFEMNCLEGEKSRGRQYSGASAERHPVSQFPATTIIPPAFLRNFRGPAQSDRHPSFLPWSGSSAFSRAVSCLPKDSLSENSTQKNRLKGLSPFWYNTTFNVRRAGRHGTTYQIPVGRLFLQ